MNLILFCDSCGQEIPLADVRHQGSIPCPRCSQSVFFPPGLVLYQSQFDYSIALANNIISIATFEDFIACVLELSSLHKSFILPGILQSTSSALGFFCHSVHGQSMNLLLIAINRLGRVPLFRHSDRTVSISSGSSDPDHSTATSGRWYCSLIGGLTAECALQLCELVLFLLDASFAAAILTSLPHCSGINVIGLSEMLRRFSVEPWAYAFYFCDKDIVDIEKALDTFSSDTKTKGRTDADIVTDACSVLKTISSIERSFTVERIPAENQFGLLSAKKYLSLARMIVSRSPEHLRDYIRYNQEIVKFISKVGLDQPDFSYSADTCRYSLGNVKAEIAGMDLLYELPASYAILNLGNRLIYLTLPRLVTMYIGSMDVLNHDSKGYLLSAVHSQLVEMFLKIKQIPLERSVFLKEIEDEQARVSSISNTLYVEQLVHRLEKMFSRETALQVAKYGLVKTPAEFVLAVIAISLKEKMATALNIQGTIEIEAFLAVLLIKIPEIVNICERVLLKVKAKEEDDPQRRGKLSNEAKIEILSEIYRFTISSLGKDTEELTIDQIAEKVEDLKNRERELFK